MTVSRVKIPGLGLRGWTSLPHCQPGEIGRYSRWLNTGYKGLWIARGYKRYRLVKATLDKPGGSWVHRDTDGKEYPFYYFDTELLPETGSDSPTAFKTGLSSSYAPSVVPSPDQGESVFLQGDNTKAVIIREDGANALTDVPFDLAQPDANWTVVAATTGGSLADGTYLVRIAQLDKAGNYAAQSEPAAAKSVTVSGGGGNGKITVAHNTWTPDARTTFWRIGVTGVGGTDAPAQFLYSATGSTGGRDLAIATTTMELTDLTSDTAQAFPSRNSVYRQATLPLSAVDFAVEHLGRLVIFSRATNEAYFSERGQFNHFYNTSSINTTAETGWASPCRAAASVQGGLYVCTANGIYIVTGSWRSDDSGNTKTFTRDMATTPIDRNIGGVAHNAIDVIGSVVYFWSTLGPARIAGAGVTVLEPYDNIRVELDSVDLQYASRITSAEDPSNRYWCVAVPRKVNSSRAMDGASVAGVPDLIWRYDIPRGIWAAPLQMDVTHLSARENAGSNVEGGDGTTDGKIHLMAMSPNGYSLQLNYGTSTGGADDITGTIYDGALATTNGTTSAVITQSGVTADDYNAMLVGLFYPTVDTAYPGVLAIKTITDVTVAGTDVTISWAGALTVPTSTKWTVRVGTMASLLDWAADLSDYVQIEPGMETRLNKVTVELHDVIGAEAVA